MTADPTSLRLFRVQFMAALLAPADAARAAPFDLPAFDVYRNTVRRGAIDALVANYPVIEQMVGAEWLRAAAAVYVEAHWPRSPVLLNYGVRFADFLCNFAPARELPYLAAVARFDRLWTESHLASDAAVLTLAELATAGAALGEAHLVVHPATRWAWSDAAPAFTLWQRSRARASLASVDWVADGGLITRPDGAVRWQPLSRAAVALLDALVHGATLAVALKATRQALDEAAELLAPLVAAGAFTAIKINGQRLV